MCFPSQQPAASECKNASWMEFYFAHIEKKTQPSTFCMGAKKKTKPNRIIRSENKKIYMKFINQFITYWKKAYHFPSAFLMPFTATELNERNVCFEFERRKTGEKELMHFVIDIGNGEYGNKNCQHPLPSVLPLWILSNALICNDKCKILLPKKSTLFVRTPFIILAISPILRSIQNTSMHIHGKHTQTPERKECWKKKVI